MGTTLRMVQGVLNTASDPQDTADILNIPKTIGPLPNGATMHGLTTGRGGLEAFVSKL